MKWLDNKIKVIIFLSASFIFQATQTQASDFEEFNQDECRASFLADELEGVPASCFKLKKTKKTQCVAAAEYRIIENREFIILIDYVFSDHDCSWNTDATTTRSFKRHMERWPYIKNNLKGIKFLKTSYILDIKSKVFDVQLSGYDNCIGFNVRSGRHRALLSGIICGKENPDDEKLINIVKTLELRPG